MIRAVHPIKKSPCCRSQQHKPSIFRETSQATQAEESNQPGEPSPLMQCSLMDIPEQAPLQPKVAAGEQQVNGIAEKSASPVIQRYVRVGLYEGSFGLDHIGVGVNSEKTLGFSPKEGLSREAEKGSWVDGEVKEDHGLLDSLTIRTNPWQEARLQAALNQAESSSLKFNLSQHNCSQHGAEILKSAGLNAKSSPVPRAFFEGLKKQYASGQKEAAADGQPVQGKFTSNAPAAEPGTRPNRTGMPDRLKTGIESLSGMDMSDVRVHPNSELPKRLDALAYTQGNQIYLGPGEEKHLPHEAWHVVQQKQGRVRATRQMKGVGVNEDGELENEASTMGLKAGQPVAASERKTLMGKLGEGVVQRAEIPDIERANKAIKDRNMKIVERALNVNLNDSQRSILETILDEPDANVCAFQTLDQFRTFFLEKIQQRMRPQASKGVQPIDETTASSFLTKTIGELPPNFSSDRGQMNHPSSLKGVQSTEFLSSFIPKTDTSKWRGDGHDELAGAHHKLGKNVMAWLYEHMEKKHQMELKKSLYMDLDSGANAMTRLGSNLISPKQQGKVVALSDKRTDDPMNNRDKSVTGEEYLDLIHDETGSLTPRSQDYSELAHGLIRDIYNRYDEWFRSGEKNSQEFILSEEDVRILIEHLLHAEIVNLREEGDVGIPSHSREDAFDCRGSTYTKKNVKPINPEVTEESKTSFKLISAKRLEEKLRKKAEAKRKKATEPQSFEDWYNFWDRDSDDIDDAKDEYDVYLEEFYKQHPKEEPPNT